MFVCNPLLMTVRLLSDWMFCAGIWSELYHCCRAFQPGEYFPIRTRAGASLCGDDVRILFNRPRFVGVVGGALVLVPGLVVRFYVCAGATAVGYPPHSLYRKCLSWTGQRDQTQTDLLVKPTNRYISRFKQVHIASASYDVILTT